MASAGIICFTSPQIAPRGPQVRDKSSVCSAYGCLCVSSGRFVSSGQLAPDPKQARTLRVRFDRIFTRQTGYVMLDRQMARLHKQKADLLRVLERPEIPLHTNGSENDIRAFVTKRKISGGTVSEQGRIARDTMLGLMKTCAKLRVSFYQFLGDRFAVPGAPTIQWLPDLVMAAPA